MGCKGKAKGHKNHGSPGFFHAFLPAGYQPGGEGLTPEQFPCQFCRFIPEFALGTRFDIGLIAKMKISTYAKR